MSVKALQTQDLQTQDLGSMVVEAHAEGFITKIKLNSFSNLLPAMEATFDGTMESIKKMTKQLTDAVKEFKETIPNDGSIEEAVGTQIMMEMVKAGGIMIRKMLESAVGAI